METRKIELGISAMPLALITIIQTSSLKHRNRFLVIHILMGDELGSENDIDRLLASSELSTPIFTLIGNNDSWSCRRDFRPKTSPKNGDF